MNKEANDNPSTISDTYEPEFENKKCNMCGGTMDIFDLHGHYTIDSVCGYGTVHDGDHVCINLCCKCFDKLIDMCKLYPIQE